jgi:hypothetical protein
VTITFDDGAAGWTVVSDAQGGAVVPDHVTESRSPGGHLRTDEDDTGGIDTVEPSG